MSYIFHTGMLLKLPKPMPAQDITPHICRHTYVFVSEAFRGHRLSQRLIEFAMECLKSIGFDKVYIVSDH